MARALAFTQFIIIVLGAAVLHLLVRLDHPGQFPGFVAAIALFVAHHALWLLAIPIFWAIGATTMKGHISDTVVHIIGAALSVAVLLLIGLPIAYYLL
jgi:hypothetical protein